MKSPTEVASSVPTACWSTNISSDNSIWRLPIRWLDYTDVITIASNPPVILLVLQEIRKAYCLNYFINQQKNISIPTYLIIFSSCQVISIVRYIIGQKNPLVYSVVTRHTTLLTRLFHSEFRIYICI